MAKKRVGRLLFVHQNVRGIKSDEKQEELFGSLRRRSVFAAMLQETWLSGDESYERFGYTAICSGLATEEQCRRGQQGAAVVLSPTAKRAWDASGNFVIRVSARVIELRLAASDDKGREVSLFLVSAYAPVGCAPQHEWDSFFGDVDIAMGEMRKDGVLVVGIDMNSSLGVRSKWASSTVCGP